MGKRKLQVKKTLEDHLPNDLKKAVAILVVSLGPELTRKNCMESTFPQEMISYLFSFLVCGQLRPETDGGLHEDVTFFCIGVL